MKKAPDIRQYRDEMFRLGTSTEPVDKPRAEAAVRELADLLQIPIERVVWVSSPAEGMARYSAEWESVWGLVSSRLDEKLSPPIKTALEGLPSPFPSKTYLIDPLREGQYQVWRFIAGELRRIFRSSLEDKFTESLSKGMAVSLMEATSLHEWRLLRSAFTDPPETLVAEQVEAQLRGFLVDYLNGSLWESLFFSKNLAGDSEIGRNLSEQLQDSLLAVLWDLGWASYCSWAEATWLVVYPIPLSEKLAAIMKVLQSCFACWLLPTAAILCERPKTVKIEDGKLVGLSWEEGKVDNSA